MNVHLERLENVRSRVEKACQSAHRDVLEVTLLAVSKTRPASAIRAMHQLGHRVFGENRLQEALVKLQELADIGLEWHFIGPVQSNKTRELAAHFDWVQSVDRKKILQRLAAHRPGNKPALNICLQVNIDREPQKAGLLPEALGPLAEIAENIPGIRLRGLMCIPRFSDDQEALNDSFARMRSLYEDMREQGHQLDTLSMGMSADLEAAIAAGSTMIRIGTDLFGPRLANTGNTT